MINVDIRFNAAPIPSGWSQITVCGYGNYPNGDKNTEHYRAFDSYAKSNGIGRARYHYWPYLEGVIDWYYV